MRVLFHLPARPAFERCSRRALRAVLCAGLLTACKSSDATATNGVAQVAPEPERFQFTLPSDYTAHDLRGEGSETLNAPADARVRSESGGLRVEAGPEFALDVLFQPSLVALPAPPAGARRAYSENDVVVFESGGAYSFVVLRELVPEWDESDRRRVLCSSAGAAEPGGTPRRFSRAGIERMVAACRSLALPPLE